MRTREKECMMRERKKRERDEKERNGGRIKKAKYMEEKMCTKK